jgi:MFS family permease
MKLKSIPRQVIILGIISFFTDFASEMLYPIVPIFLTVALGASMATVGVIEGIAEVTAGLLKGYFGALSDKSGKRSIFVVIGYSLSALFKPLPGLLPYISTVLISRTSDRIGKGIRTAPRDALLASYANGNTGAIFGFHRSLDTFGAVVGPLVALLLLLILPGDYKIIFLAAIIPSVFAIYFTFKVKDPPKSNSKTNLYSYKIFWQNASKEYKVILLLLTIFSLVNSSDVFLILKSRDIAQSDTIAILGYVFYNFVYALLSYPLGIIADRFSKRTVIVFGLFIFSIVYAGFAMIESFLVIWILFALYGTYSAATEGVVKAWVSDIIHDDHRATAIGLLTSLMGLSVMAGSIIAGFLWDQFGSTVPFLVSSILSFIIALIFVIQKK